MKVKNSFVDPFHFYVDPDLRKFPIFFKKNFNQLYNAQNLTMIFRLLFINLLFLYIKQKRDFF